MLEVVQNLVIGITIFNALAYIVYYSIRKRRTKVACDNCPVVNTDKRKKLQAV